MLFSIDHQTFRKLPRSKAIIFRFVVSLALLSRLVGLIDPILTSNYARNSVHPILRRLETFADLPLVPALLATVHEKAPADLMKYKLAPVYQEKMLPYLKKLTQSQIDRGLIKCVFLFSLLPSSPVSLTCFSFLRHNRGDEDVSNFRDLLSKA